MTSSAVSNSNFWPLAHQDSFAAELDDEFATRFQHWLDEDGQWTGANGDQAQVSGCPSEMADIASSVNMSQMPRVIETDDDCLLAVPVAPGRVATARFADTSAEALLRRTERFLKYCSVKRENERLVAINESLAQHVTDNYEQLAFLSKIAGLLALGQESNPMDLIQAILPHMIATLKAESLVMITPERNWRNLLIGDICWAGEKLLEEDDARRLGAIFAPKMSESAIIENRFQSSELASGFPKVNSIMAVNVGEDALWGQLFAFNHVAMAVDQSTAWQGSETLFGTVEATLLTSAGSLLSTHFHNIELLHQKEDLFTEIVFALVNAIEAKDAYISGHSERVALFAVRLGQQIGLDQEALDRLHLSGLLHDVGKIAISDAALKKNCGLTQDELKEVSRHPIEGWGILSDLEHLRHILPGVLHHHERFDGTGYPDGLVGDEIPMDGRILAICDAYDAMTSDRSYRPRMAEDKVEVILRAGAGTQWDPVLIDAFFTALPDIATTRREYRPRTRPRRRKRGER